jgi:hypothetical protein
MRLLITLLLGAYLLQNKLVAQTNMSEPNGQGKGTFQAQGNLPQAKLDAASESLGTSLSPEGGMDGFNWDGKNFKITDLKIIDSKFSAYLNEPEISFQEEKEYNDLIREILEKLDVFKVRQKGRSLLNEVLPLLAKASQHPRDGGVCRQIYNAVGVDVQSKDAAKSKQMRIKEIEKEIDTIKWNISVAAKPSSMDVRPRGGESGTYYQYEEAQREKKTRLAFMQNDLENKYTELLATQNSIVSKTDDARFALQRLIVSNFLARRFDHVMIATSFYRLLYPDGASEVKLQERVIAEAAENAKRLRSATSFDKTETTTEQIGFGSSGIYSNRITSRANKEEGITSMLPNATEALGSITAAKIKVASLIPETMTEVELASQEAIDQCNRYVSVVRGHIENQEIDNALERLREAFAFGEQLAVIRSFPRESKQLLWKYKKALKEARTGIAAKDFDKAKEAIVKIDQMTSDNPLSKEGSDIGNVETISAMHLAKAKEAASRGDRDAMNKELEEASKAWPQNPALASATEKIIDQLDQQSQNKSELRKLIQQKNYKYIFDEKARFLASAADDEKLLSELNRVLQEHSSALSYSGKAEELLKRNDAFGAWETADEGLKKYPESTELIKIRADAAMKVPDFVTEIDKGRSSVVRQDYVSALCAFLAAKRLYHSSILAKEGIEECSAKALAF